MIENEAVAKLLKLKSFQIIPTPIGKDENGDFVVKTQIKTFEDGGRTIELVNKIVKESTMVVVKDVSAFAKGKDEIEATENSIIATAELLGL